MGLLETRLLNFENVIMLSVNEGKLPLGNSQNTYIPFDIRRFFDLHTFWKMTVFMPIIFTD
jgi:inactivated superfamily I helicase